jgi:C_GCAxxG_C_C family probable redox protein
VERSQKSGWQSQIGPFFLETKINTPLIRTPEALAGLVRNRAENLFETHQLLCSEAVLYVLNGGLKGGLSSDMAVRLASGFGEGIGRAGCMCGALAGAMMGLGLFLGREGLNGKGSKRVLGRARDLHKTFKTEFGSTCCNVLTKKIAHDHKALFSQCANHTGEASEMAARIILDARPELFDQADWDFLEQRDSKLEAGIGKLFTLIRP